MGHTSRRGFAAASITGLVTATALLTGPASPAGAQGETCPNRQLRQGVASHLPDCRAYEQVSPVQKNGYDIKPLGTSGSDANTTGGGPIAEGGNAIAYRSDGSFADAEWGGSGGFGPLAYLARRDSDGWRTTSLLPPPTVNGFASYGVFAFSMDMTGSVLESGLPLTSEPIDGRAFYRRSTAPGSDPILVANTQGLGDEAASASLESIAFVTRAVLTGEPGQPPSGTSRVYERTAGQIRLVTRRPGDNMPFQTDAALGGPGPGSSRFLEGAMSEDGRHVFFSSPFGNIGQDERVIYRRTDGTSTMVASPSKRTPPDPDGPQAKNFQVAARDANRVFFTSAERLTDNANTPGVSSAGDLYRYDIGADQLLNLSATTPGDADADVQGVVEVSDGGDRVYFTALGLVGGDGAAGEPNLYLWEDDGTAHGITRFIATLDGTGTFFDPSDEVNWSWGPTKSAEATPDGRQLVFESVADIDGYDPGGTTQVYLYDAEANGGAGDLTCLSCDRSGPSAGDAFVPLPTQGIGDERPRFISDDGSRVPFTSPEALLARDSNGKLDAYLWARTSGSSEPLAGKASLLSSGSSAADSHAFALSASGDDAFFRTRERLVAQDIDFNVDLYTARVNGGLKSQQDDATPECEGDGCQGEPSNPPPATAPGSSDFTGPGNPSAEEDPGARSCTKVERRADRAKRKAKRAKQRLKRVRRKARRAEGKRERRLERKLKRTKTKARKAKRKAKRLKRRARRCKRDAE